MLKKPKPIPIKTIEIEVALARFFNYRTSVIVPNISWGFKWMHECDMFILRKSGYAIEVEIKISKANLKADFKKGHDHKSKYIREFYYAFPKQFYEEFLPLIPEHAGIITCEKFCPKDYAPYIVTQVRRKAKINTGALKLSDKDRIKISHLGTMRIWSAKAKEIKLNEKIIELKNK